jgi:chaperonin GroEL|tara:strand:+ start:2220 stop:3818 length:1599 start_codon:yes stop_codon:yes gene_type:complete
MQESGITPKKLEFDEEARAKLVSGIETIAQAVGSTLGPAGQTVLIESPHHTHGITVTKDGVTVAKAVDLIDPTENLAVRMMKEAAERTATSAGDGTTTSIVLTRALVRAGMDFISTNAEKTDVLRDLMAETDKVVASLKKNSRSVTKSRLKDVATISSNNDSNIGDIISKIYKEVGDNGIVTVDRSMTNETYYETTHGLKMDRGYLSNLFINDHKRDECILEDVHILVSDAEISNVLQIESILKPIITDNKKLLIIAPCSSNVVNTIAANVMKRDMKICIVSPPNFGYRQHELMNDIALSVGATYFSEKTGDDLSLMEFSDLGHAEKIIAGSDSSIILKDNTKEVDKRIVDRVNQLRDLIKITTKQADIDFTLSRIASLTGGIGVIYAGGNTDLEQKELFDRIDDAVCAVRSALEEGILPGGGIALYNEARKYDCSEKIAEKILAVALRAPLEQIFNNAGLDIDIDENKSYDYGYNIKTGEFGDMYKMGVIDPLKVTRSALENAVSVAATILSTNAIITMARSIEQATNYTS